LSLRHRKAERRQWELSDVMVLTETITFDSDGYHSSCNLTEQVRDIVYKSGIQQGMVFIFFRHTTGAIMIVEHEAGFIVDLEETLERLVPRSLEFKHHMRDYDQNGRSHVLASLLNTTVSVPFHNGDLLLGTYQDIFVIDFQAEPKSREVIVQIIGE
jgi:secondary thiamine-phosphate synthase enzyme